MKVGHIYATQDGESHIGELDILLSQNEGRLEFYNSTRFAATAIGFQHVRVGGATAWHNPPQRWLAFILVGTWEIETSDGARRQFPRLAKAIAAGQWEMRMCLDSSGKVVLERRRQ